MEYCEGETLAQDFSCGESCIGKQLTLRRHPCSDASSP
jgi:hypothetical protein